MVSPNQLDSAQSDAIDAIVDNPDQTHWISGYAGSGKTVVLTHAINRTVRRYRNESVGFITYTHALKDLVATGIDARLIDEVDIQTIKAFSSHSKVFDHLFVDEVQDMEPREIEKLRSHSRHLVVAGDPDQSIYQNRVNPADLKRLIGTCTEHKLSTIYRLSKNTRQIASTIYPAGGIKGARKFGGANDMPAELRVSTSPDDEAVAIFNQALAVCAEGLPSAVILPGHPTIYEFACLIAQDRGLRQPPRPTKKSTPFGQTGSHNYQPFNDFFENNDVPLMYIGNDYGSLAKSDDVPMVYLMTYHSSKGLDFPQVFLPRLAAGASVGYNFDSEENKRRIMFVAVTRSRSRMTFSYSGRPHRFLDEIAPLLAGSTF
jgi:superfamily I DNA/RNA helicase